MPERPWKRRLRCRFHRPVGGRLRRRTKWIQSKRGRGVPPLLLTLLVGVMTAWCTIALLESRLRPIVRDAAQYQIKNRLVSALEHEITREMTAYGALVEIHRGADGRITSLTADTAALNLLRADLVSGVMDALENTKAMEVSVPLGSLLDTELIWGRGPAIQVRSIVLGTVSAEFESSFSSAGINQTQHRLWLDVSLPVRLFLPGGPADISVETRLTVAETVIVGELPDLVLGTGAEDALTS